MNTNVLWNPRTRRARQASMASWRHGDSDDDIRELQERSIRALQGSRDGDKEVPAAGSMAGDDSQNVATHDLN